jgi:predicted permease
VTTIALLTEALWQDLRDAGRALRRRPAFTAATITVLALGIGANAAMFSLVDAVVLRPLPFRDPERLVWVWHTWAGGDTGVFAIPDLLEYRARNRSFDGLAAFTGWGASLADRESAERLSGIRVTGNFFSLLGVTAAQGRTVGEPDDRPDSPRVAVITDGLWRRRFGADPALVGQAITLNGESHVVIGILPAAFLFPITDAEVAVPLVMDTDPYRAVSAMNFLRVVGRLKPHADSAQATADMAETTAYLRKTNPDDNSGKFGVRLVGLQDQIAGSHRLTLFLLLGGVTFVLLMTCTNLANLLLAHTAARQQEFAVRTALGGGRTRLVRQVLCENLLLSTLGGAIGIGVSWAGVRMLLTMLPAALPRADRAVIDTRVLVLTVFLALIAGVLIGAWPALRAARMDPLAGLRSQDRAVAGSRRRFETVLLMGQVAIALTLLVGAGLFLRSFARLQAVAPGFSVENTLTMRLSLPRRVFNRPEPIARFFDQMIEQVEGLPQVDAASIVSILPLTAARSTTTFTIVGAPAPAPGEEPIAHLRIVGPHYFRAMRIPLAAGRAFEPQDNLAAQPVAIVNETAASRLWPRGDALNATIAIDNGKGLRHARIVGIVTDTRHLGLDQPAAIDLYLPIHQLRQTDVVALTNSMFLVVRSEGNPMTLAGPAGRILQSINRDIAASSVRSMEQVAHLAVGQRRFTMQLLGLFAGAALLLAVSGVYATAAQIASRRTREISIRLALGAARRDIAWLVVRGSLGPVIAGSLLGVAGAVATGRLVQGLLFETSGFDPVAFATAAGLLVLAAVAASCVPTARALRTTLKLTD